MTVPKPLTEKEIQFIKDNYKKLSITEMTKRLNIPYTRVYRGMEKLNINTSVHAFKQPVKKMKTVKKGMFNVDSFGHEFKTLYTW